MIITERNRSRRTCDYCGRRVRDEEEVLLMTRKTYLGVIAFHAECLRENLEVLLGDIAFV